MTTSFCLAELFSGMTPECEPESAPMMCQSPGYMHWPTSFTYDSNYDPSTPPPCTSPTTMFFMAYGSGCGLQSWYPSPVPNSMAPGLVEVNTLPPGVIGLQPVIGAPNMYNTTDSNPMLSIEEITAEPDKDQADQVVQSFSAMDSQGGVGVDDPTKTSFCPSNIPKSMGMPLPNQMPISSAAGPNYPKMDDDLRAPDTPNIPYNPCPTSVGTYETKYDYNGNMNMMKSYMPMGNSVSGNFHCEALEASFKTNTPLTGYPGPCTTSCPPGFPTIPAPSMPPPLPSSLGMPYPSSPPFLPPMCPMTFPSPLPSPTLPPESSVTLNPTTQASPLDVAGVQLKHYLASAKHTLPAVADQNPTTTLKSRCCTHENLTETESTITSPDAGYFTTENSSPFAPESELKKAESFETFSSAHYCPKYPAEKRSEHIPHSASSPQLGEVRDTPKKCRLAARFNSPVSAPTSPENSRLQE